MRRTTLLSMLGALALLALLIPAASFAERPQPHVFGTPLDTVHVDDNVTSGTLPVLEDFSSTAITPFAFEPGMRNQLRTPARARTRSGLRGLFSHTPVVGETRNWFALDDLAGFYRKTFTLRGIGDHIEVWVASEANRRGASGLHFPDGDCRNGARTVVTDEQVNYLVSEFETNIYPKESAAFSTPPSRNGDNNLIEAIFGPPGVAAFPHPQGPGEKTVVLVDNVRDENFYDPNNSQGFSYIAGFFSSQLNDYFDRNIMSIDGFDWLHRTGDNPPNEPTTDLCTSATARPNLYESVFAHEYQHLLESYEDPDEVNWVNEGLSDWAEALTGYSTPATPITKIGFDSHTQCFLGWLGVQTPANPIPRNGGPENSLTLWEDQGDDEILCDYGAAYTMMLFLANAGGTEFMSALHRGDANGLEFFRQFIEERKAAGDKRAAKVDVDELINHWALMVALDGFIDEGRNIVSPLMERYLSVRTLNAKINWDTPDAYSTPGAPPNGSDYVRVRDASGKYLGANQIDSFSFQGSSTLPSLPVAWTVDADPPLQPDDPALYSGTGNNRDEAIVREVAVPTGNATVTFNALWNLEVGWDFAFVQISTDGGMTYKSVACPPDTTTDTDPGALPTAKENVPGFTGYSGGWKSETCSLSAYAGQTVLLAFRVFNDPAVQGQTEEIPPGFWVDDIAVGGTLISDGSTLEGWRSFTEVRPTSVAGFDVHIITMRTDSRSSIRVARLPLTSDFTVEGDLEIAKYVDRRADFVGAVITYHDPTETSNQYAPYRLTVNGVVQPGGGM